MEISILGLNIKKIREEKNMSAYRLAKIANVGAATISQIESGNRQSLNSDTVEKIAAALDVTTDVLFAVDTDEEYIVTDIEQTLNIILTSEELVLDDIEMTELEKNQLKIIMKAGLNAIRLQRGK